MIFSSIKMRKYSDTLKVQMILVLMFEINIDTVLGLKSWSLRNVNLRDTDPNIEVKTFYPDMPAIRILDESMCRGVQTMQVKFRLFPLEEVGSVVEDTMDAETRRRMKSCLYKGSSISSKCEVCWQEHCDSRISLPCKSLLGVSRWDSALLIDVTIDQGTIVNCSVMCRDIGYYEDDIYKGGNGISMVGVGIIIAVVLVLGSLAMLSVILVKSKLFKKLKEDEAPYTYKMKPVQTFQSDPYPTKPKQHPFIKKEGGMIEF